MGLYQLFSQDGLWEGGVNSAQQREDDEGVRASGIQREPEETRNALSGEDEAQGGSWQGV